jgi:alpha-glucosidase
MHIKTTILCVILAFVGASLQAQPYTTAIPPLGDEKWWGGMVGNASKMPFQSNTPLYDLARQNFNNQNVPLLVSSRGRYVWSETAFRFQMRGDTLFIHSDEEEVQVVEAGRTLKEACMAAARTHFPSTGSIPEEVFFSQPQYNTWIELMYDQNQEAILDYAHKLLENGFPAGIFMVDDNWQRYYGNFDFKAEKFADARAMTDELHRMGFKIMLWVCPFYSPDSPEFRELRDKGYLLKNKANGSPAIIRWWNGYSACLDVTNPQAVAYFKDILRRTQERYGVDGFKFDAGDVEYMTGRYAYYDTTATRNVFSQRWAEIGLDFPFNELRTTWKTGGQPLVQRLGDKAYAWSSNKALIPGMTTAGLLGFAYTCPDMIGGGEFSSFLHIEAGSLDEELIVRSCQIHAMMPMMQFSVAPWRVLSKENREICARFARLHVEMGDYILACARRSALTNEPIVQSMEYAFPHQGFIDCDDQFMLGEKYLVAPMVTPAYQRPVKLPPGRWRDERGKVFKGKQTIRIDVPLDRLPYFERLE